MGSTPSQKEESASPCLSFPKFLIGAPSIRSEFRRTRGLVLGDGHYHQADHRPCDGLIVEQIYGGLIVRDDHTRSSKIRLRVMFFVYHGLRRYNVAKHAYGLKDKHFLYFRWPKTPHGERMTDYSYKYLAIITDHDIRKETYDAASDPLHRVPTMLSPYDAPTVSRLLNQMTV